MKESAGRKKGTGSTGHGNPYLARVLGEAAIGASKTNTFLGQRYRRIARRRRQKKAMVAVGSDAAQPLTDQVQLLVEVQDPLGEFAKPGV